MSTTDTVPRTANLLACRQWWKVCFLYGDQEKYYRQIYGKAASQRLASSQRLTSPQRIIYPTKLLDPVVLNGSPPRTIESRKRCRETSKEKTIPHSRVTVLDDPFLFGIDNDYGSDSGIDASGRNTKSPSGEPPKPILKNRIEVKRPDYNQTGLPSADLERVRNLSTNRNRSTICDVTGVVENAMMSAGNHDDSSGSCISEEVHNSGANNCRQFHCLSVKSSALENIANYNQQKIDNNNVGAGVGYESLAASKSIHFE